MREKETRKQLADKALESVGWTPIVSKRARRKRVAAETAKLDPKEERALAEEGLAAGVEMWPAY